MRFFPRDHKKTSQEKITHFFTIWGHLSQLVMRQLKSQEKITDSQTFFYSMGRLLGENKCVTKDQGAVRKSTIKFNNKTNRTSTVLKLKQLRSREEI